MKLKRKNGLTVGIIALSAVAITSVGFASWVISAGDTKSVAGNIEVDDVSTSNHDVVGIYENVMDAGYTGSTEKINAPTVKSAQSIRFGSNRNKYGNVATDSSSLTEEDDSWLRYKVSDDLAFYENLKATYYVQIKNTSAAADLTSVKLEIYDQNPSSVTGFTTENGTSVGTYTNKGWTAAKALTLVAMPDTINVNKVTGSDLTALKAKVTGEEETSGVTYDWLKIDFTFKWGALFGGNNPYDYYNGLTNGSATQIAQSSATGFPAVGTLSASKHAQQFLTALDELLAGVEFRLTVKTYGDATERDNDEDTFKVITEADQTAGYVDIVTNFAA